jgi:hypothetical protein
MLQARARWTRAQSKEIFMCSIVRRLWRWLRWVSHRVTARAGCVLSSGPQSPRRSQADWGLHTAKSARDACNLPNSEGSSEVACDERIDARVPATAAVGMQLMPDGQWLPPAPRTPPEVSNAVVTTASSLVPPTAPLRPSSLWFCFSDLPRSRIAWRVSPSARERKCRRQTWQSATCHDNITARLATGLATWIGPPDARVFAARQAFATSSVRLS